MVLLAACSNGGDGGAAASGPGATVGTAPATTTTTDPYAVPAVIDAAYVNRVLAGLDQAYGDVVRMMVSAKGLPPEAFERLKALYGDRDLLNLHLRVLQENVRFRLAEFPDDLGNKVTRVSELLNSGSSCIYARVIRDYAAVTRRTSPPREEWVALRPIDPALSSSGFNPTNWVFTYEGSDPNGQPPRTSPCSPG